MNLLAFFRSKPKPEPEPEPEIVKAGVLARDRTYEWKCPECDCVFRFQGTDARIGRSGYGSGLLVTIACPTCGIKVTHGPEHVER